jgi:hypothetical protein
MVTLRILQVSVRARQVFIAPSPDHSMIGAPGAVTIFIFLNKKA